MNNPYWFSGNDEIDSTPVRLTDIEELEPKLAPQSSSGFLD